MKTALITGITSQDGAYLSQFLLNKGYRVIGLTRSQEPFSNRGLYYLGIVDQVEVSYYDMLDISNLIGILKKYEPDEIYNLAAQSSVSESFNQPLGTIEFNTISVLNLLESVRQTGFNSRIYQASSSEMFGKVESLPVTEKTAMHPLSPYGISKASAHWCSVHYREAFNLFSCAGILFNHESYLRRGNFFIKKVIRDCIAIRDGRKEDLRVGNIDIRRDFGYAPEYVKVMWKMLQLDEPDDFIICSGRSVCLRDVVEFVFDYLKVGKDRIIIDKNLYRPAEIEDIYGSSAKARRVLDWNYEMDFFNVLKLLIEEELNNGCGG